MSYKRTAVALVLTAVAVAVPSGAWYFALDRQAEREIALREREVYGRAFKEGDALAGRLATRLEVLREAESRRPFYHYQNLFHDPQAAAVGASVSISPLAHGPADSLIAGHFQVDEKGRLSLPTVNDEFPELGLQDVEREQCLLASQLEEVAFFCTEQLRATNPAACAGIDPEAGNEGNDLGAGAGRDRIERLTQHGWQQHLDANALYADLKYAGKKDARSDLELPAGADLPVAIIVSPFRWYTRPVAAQPALVALRTVSTPAGDWLQGFVIAAEAVGQQLAHASYPASFAPTLELEHRGLPGRVVAAVAGTPWGVELDVSAGLRETLQAATADRERSFGTFLLTVVAAGLAGLLVVVMVHQSERLALQRAQFAAAAAHELRTPLAGLQLYGEMLAEGLGNPAQAGEYARRVAEEAERLGRVVTNILSLTRLEREPVALDVQPGDLAEAVDAAVRHQQPALEQAGVRVELDLPRDLPAVCFDRDAVIHIVQNLLDNAEKYTRGVADRRIVLGLAREASGVVLSVVDNGPGVARTQQRRLFRPFARGDHGQGTEGLGLGLVLVKALTTAQGGKICYRDAPGGGAQLRVTFPHLS